MKLTTLLTSACAATAILLTACDDKPAAGAASSGSPAASGGGAVSEKDALDAFKKASVEINALIKEGKAAGDPVSGLPKMQAAIEKMKAIKTDGLPADLKESFSGAREGMESMLSKFKDLPKDPAELGAFMQKLMTDPATAKLMETGKAASEKFKEVATKYGIEIAD